MDGRISIAYLQSYIKSKDNYMQSLIDARGLPADAARELATREYFLKLAEETGELARAMHKGLRPASPEDIRGTVDEELWDVIYFALAIANCYGIDLEAVIPKKEAFNNIRYPGPAPFEMDR